MQIPPPPPPPKRFYPRNPNFITGKPAIAREVQGPQHTPSPGVVRHPHAPPCPLLKQHSWSPDLIRDEAWSKRRDSFRHRRHGKSLTDDDLDDLNACIELGFGFGSPEVSDPRLSHTLPALPLYFAVQRSYNDAVSNKSTASSSSLPDCESPSASPLHSPHTIFEPSDNPQTVKTRLRQWARVVACTVKQSSPR
ncbi:PREDICTED: uncharacterized protein LOC104821552 [Tarenaya hassleriana]|uniref:uncharacterized protein LOC104821552 n=1 Tax=Tarenaya hassleriana TaxID=28532 RepID=UPI00053C8D50|nr:PREDICTED: uncharacterized protein LOC104821552 [Tarenaya hassleriana]